MEDLVGVLILMGATQVAHNKPSDEFEGESLSFKFGGKCCWIGSHAANTGAGYLSCDVYNE